MKFGLDDTTIAKITTVFEANPKIDKASIFGSRAKGNFRKDSDIDIALKGFDITPDDILKLSVALDDEGIKHKVDLIDFTTINEPELKAHIDRVGIEFYSRWREVELGEIIEYVNRGVSPTYVEDDGIQILNQKCIRNGRIDYNLARLTSKNKSYTAQKQLIKNDILINSTGVGTAGRVSRFLSNHLCYVDTHVSIVRINKKLADPSFVFFNLNSREEELENYAEGSTGQIELGRERIKHIKITLPHYSEQTTIASILSGLDDKIDLLHRQNQTLEQLAETLFKQWFLLEAGDDWEQGTLEVIATFHNGKSRPNETGDIPVYGGNGILDYTNISNYKGKSIIIGRVGAYCGSLYFENKEIWVSDNALLAKSKNEKHIYFLFYLLKKLGLNSMAEGSSHPLLTQTLLKSIKITIPPNSKMELFYDHVDIWINKIEDNQTQIQTLTKLRDTLLPKLMSGEVRVELN